MSESEEIKLPPLPIANQTELEFHEIKDAEHFAATQERFDALRLARIGVLTHDPLTQKIALARWNRTVPPNEQYTSAEDLWVVEGLDIID